MARIVYRGAYATFPMVGLTAGDLAYATDYLLLYEWSGTAWIAYGDYPDYQGDKSKLFTAADWAALEATDHNLGANALNVAFDAGALVLYRVPAGRTLYITQVGYECFAAVAADADNNQICRALIWDVTAVIALWRQGGNGGGSAIFSKPLVVPALHQVRIAVYNEANHNCNIAIQCGGYLI